MGERRGVGGSRRSSQLSRLASGSPRPRGLTSHVTFQSSRQRRLELQLELRAPRAGPACVHDHVHEPGVRCAVTCVRMWRHANTVHADRGSSSALRLYATHERDARNSRVGTRENANISPPRDSRESGINESQAHCRRTVGSQVVSPRALWAWLLASRSMVRPQPRSLGLPVCSSSPAAVQQARRRGPSSSWARARVSRARR